MPMLGDSGATCSCLTEESVVILINHTYKMIDTGQVKPGDYNYPIAQFYKYTNVAHLKGAERSDGMIVEYAVSLNVEFIPEGCTTGPVKEIYFKIFKAGTSGLVGGVLGWPTLDYPTVPGGEGLAWKPEIDGFKFER